MEIAKKLMKLADVLTELENCMDKELEKKYTVAPAEVKTLETPVEEPKASTETVVVE